MQNLCECALKEHDVQCTLHVVCDGAKAIELVAGLDDDPNAPNLDLFLVDMHLPERGGEDILKRLRSTEHYAQTPVIIMSGINAPSAQETVAKHARPEKLPTSTYARQSQWQRCCC